MMHMSMGGGMLWMIVAQVILWGALIAFGVWTVRRLANHRSGGGGRRVLEERFARGEIDAQEFEQRRAVLSR